ncbi:tRNA-guanine(15) transglycosylase-like protein [Xylaria flabelliformis]|nr:tRNA-guanine(15) transglycosylase-like protein [Xylaria flabelliformis]
MVTPEPDGRTMFKILKGAVSDGVGARLGTLSLPKRRPIDTPNFIGLTARGAIPHMTPDNVSNLSELGGMYIALEDFMETTLKKTSPALLEMVSEETEPLHAFTATPSHMFTVLGARRHPAINSPIGNAKDSISIFTSTGFQKLTNEAYRQSVDKLKPDVVIPLADMTYSQNTTFTETKRRTNVTSSKRQLRMVERTEDWLAEFFEALIDGDKTAPSVFAPLLPIAYPTQWEYFNQLEQDFASKLSGLAVYDADVLPDLSNHGPLVPLPRLSLDYTATPQEVLRQVYLGIDIFTVSFLNNISDAGIALSFTFPPPSDSASGIQPLGINMWAKEHEAAVKPLVEGCKCYACTKHHRAFLHHLLNAKEMLGWTLLQVHNHQVLSDFFAGIRASLSADPPTFEKDSDEFSRVYDSELPTGTGTRPRARGYHFKSRGGDEKINAPAWGKYGTESDPALAGEMAGLAVTGAAAEGGKETPLVPDADAAELDKQGFAEISK